MFRNSALVVAFLICCGSLAWVASWYQPTRPATLLLVGAGYELNLQVPHNAYGRALLDDLAGLAPSGPSRLGVRQPCWHLPHAPRILEGRGAWDDGLNEARDAVVVVLALHGGADRGGAFLLTEDATAGGDRLRLERVLDRLGKLPRASSKVLILDATQVQSNWLLGMFRNDFARSLRALESRIASIPNLVVIASSDVGERSWVDERKGRTAFGAYLVQGLAGAAAGADGAVTARGLHDYLKDRVGEWARQNRGATQSPFLLPRPDCLPPVDRDRADRIVLTRIDSRTPPWSPREEPFEITPELADEWQDFDRQRSQFPVWRLQSLHAWRAYEALLLRFEELTLARAAAPAKMLRRSLREAREGLNRVGRFELASGSNSLAMQELQSSFNPGEGPTPDVAGLDDLFRSFWDQPTPEAARKVWVEAKLNPSARWRFDGLLLDRALADPRNLLAKVADLLPIVHDDPEAVVPIELHTLAMIQRDRPPPPASPGPDYDRAVGLALEVRRLAELAALGVSTGQVVYGEEVAPRVRAAVERADRERRPGEDLLFSSDPDDWADARDRLARARGRYQEAQALGDWFRRACTLRDECRALLPGYSDWLSRSRSMDSPATLLVRLWASLDRLESALGPGQGAESRPDLDEISRGLGDLRDSYRREVEALQATPGAREVPRIEAALRVPVPDWEGRRVLLEALGDAVRATADPGTTPASADAPIGAIASDDSSVRGVRIARAALGIGSGTDPDDVLAAGELVVARLLDSLGQVRRDLEGVARGLSGPEPSRDFVGLRRSLEDAASLSGRVPGAFDLREKGPFADGDRYSPPPLGIPGDSGLDLFVYPEIAVRDLRLQELLLWLAGRTVADHWYGEDPEASPPYYQDAGRLFLADARALDLTGNDIAGAAPDRALAASLSIRAIEARLGASEAVELSGSAPPTLTSEPEIRLDYRAAAAGPLSEAAVGLPVLWVDRVGAGLVLRDPIRLGWRTALAIGERSTSPPASTLPDSAPGILQVALSSPLVAYAESGQPPLPARTEATVTVSALWRGRRFRNETSIAVDPVAEVSIARPSPTGPARLAVRADATQLGLVGAGRGAVAFVLDCSGSMAGPLGPGGSKTKYEAIVDVLMKLLPEVPRGTRVGVWLFGQRLGPYDTADDAERTIRPILPLAPWDPSDARRLEQLARDLREQRPYNESAVVRSLVRAKDALLGIDGPRVIIALTDGIDNRFDREVADRSPRPTIPGYLLDQFRNAEAQVTVVGFRVAAAEVPATLNQFRVFQVPPLHGHLLLIDEIGPLENVLRAALRPEVRFWLEEVDGSLAPGMRSDGEEVGVTGEADRFVPAGIAPGSYRLRLRNQSGPWRDIRLGRNETLILRLTGSTAALSVRRADPFESYDPWILLARRAGWTAGVVANRPFVDGTIELLLKMNKDPRADESPLEFHRPADLWLSARPRGGEAGTLALRWVEIAGQPTPTYRIRVARYPGAAGEGLPALVELQAWWADRPAAAGLALRRGVEFDSLEELGGRSYALEGRRMTIDGVAFEEHTVEVEPGQFEARPCLVVRLAHEEDNPVRVGVDGPDIAGSEHRYYAQASRTTALFWPISSGQWGERALILTFGSVTRLKVDSEAVGRSVRFEGLSRPVVNDLTPPIEPPFDPTTLPSALPRRD